MTNDGTNEYLYNADGQICAVEQPPFDGKPVMTGYIYDADGNRVAKGNITSMSCDPSVNGFATENLSTTNYVRDQAGNQLSEFSGTSSNMTWTHTNIYANGMLMATDDTAETHFYLNDWLGTRRFQTNSVGAEEQTCSSLPYGDGETCAPPPSGMLFTGKERDPESGTGAVGTGNDYFGARYYASSMGRFMSPDPSGLYFADQTNPQSFNLYSYALNNPLKYIDPSGMGYCFYGGAGDTPQNDHDQSDYDFTTDGPDECKNSGGAYENDADTTVTVTPDGQNSCTGNCEPDPLQAVYDQDQSLYYIRLAQLSAVPTPEQIIQAIANAVAPVPNVCSGGVSASLGGASLSVSLGPGNVGYGGFQGSASYGSLTAGSSTAQDEGVTDYNSLVPVLPSPVNVHYSGDGKIVSANSAGTVKIKGRKVGISGFVNISTFGDPNC